MKAWGYLLVGSFLAAGTAVFWLTWRRLRRGARRERLLRQPLAEGFESILLRNVPLYKRLPTDLKNQLHGLINVFLAEKTFIGCKGQEITDQIRVTIAAQACMLLLNRPTRFFLKLKTIYVYPHTYVARQASSDGVIVTEGPSARAGESWQNGPVVLAWDNVAGGARNIQDGHNVVLHELAHQLDQEDGSADGAPILNNRSSYRSWARVLGHEYEQLRDKSRSRRRSVLNSYGATNPAEFFAVATETFFEKSRQMQKRHPQLYEELKDYYHLDPAQWEEN
ncbi:MAG: zinc-dependent peptidase [Sedimentisphaerales bacterium]|nr:zinc-dependent peptidase [Sedimentisphaerales bacterium]